MSRVYALSYNYIKCSLILYFKAALQTAVLYFVYSISCSTQQRYDAMCHVDTMSTACCAACAAIKLTPASKLL